MIRSLAKVKKCSELVMKSSFSLLDEEHAPQKDEGIFHINPLPNPLL